MKKTALITGATSGIGWATALTLASEYDLVICGRRKERLAELADLLKDKTDVLSLSFDVRNRSEVETALDQLVGKWEHIDVLINNAGNAHGLDPIHTGSVEDWDAMIDINMKGLLYVSKVIMPKMVSRKSGHIINIGSIAGKEVYLNGNVYCGTKHAVDAITNGMRMDLSPYGIKVTGIHPGLVETEFSEVRFKGDKSRASKVYEGFIPLSAQDVAETIAFVLNRPDHVVLCDIVLFPKAQSTATTVHRQTT